jgi:hypothetical protein
MQINSINSLVVNAFIFVIIGIVYVNSDLMYPNIMLILRGFKVYSDLSDNVVITNNKKDALTVSNNTGDELLCRNVVRGVYLVRRPK